MAAVGELSDSKALMGALLSKRNEKTAQALFFFNKILKQVSSRFNLQHFWSAFKSELRVIDDEVNCSGE